MDARRRTFPHDRTESRREPPPPPPPPPASGNLDVTTLLIAAVSSACAAFLTSQFWPGGTLWSAAASPVIVALVREGLSRPAARVKRVRLSRGGRVTDVTVPADVADHLEEVAPPPATTGGDLSPITVYGTSAERRRPLPRRWKLAVLTGLAAFAIVAVAYTVPELLSGRSLGAGGDHRTTLFGGAPAQRHKATPTPTPTATPGQTATPAPTATPTPTASPTASPTPEQPGALATPAPPAQVAPQATPTP